MTILSSISVRPGDLALMDNPLQNCVTCIIRNHAVAGITLQDIVGFPLVVGTNGADYNLAVAGGEANVIALLLDGPPGFNSEIIAASTNSPTLFSAIKRPPVIVNQNKIRTTDAAAAAFTVATIVTALKALGWEIRTEPLKVTTL